MRNIFVQLYLQINTVEGPHLYRLIKYLSDFWAGNLQVPQVKRKINNNNGQLQKNKV